MRDLNAHTESPISGDHRVFIGQTVGFQRLHGVVATVLAQGESQGSRLHGACLRSEHSDALAVAVLHEMSDRCVHAGLAGRVNRVVA